MRYMCNKEAHVQERNVEMFSQKQSTARNNHSSFPVRCFYLGLLVSPDDGAGTISV